ncbi:hypothetical protein CALCODRAFT_492428 [Calocera cornea HHB12733]|uniref:Uncharacterized protein n=1 Tax=Calocera cornea HHB12733 TaxID=1353952 RepID=A0A165IC84_9BASI|nr:hypothetical protein CALCODRAFT_492428 [Calocera cornea HHB12733]
MTHVEFLYDRKNENPCVMQALQREVSHSHGAVWPHAMCLKPISPCSLCTAGTSLDETLCKSSFNRGLGRHVQLRLAAVYNEAVLARRRCWPSQLQHRHPTSCEHLRTRPSIPKRISLRQNRDIYEPAIVLPVSVTGMFSLWCQRVQSARHTAAPSPLRSALRSEGGNINHRGRTTSAEVIRTDPVVKKRALRS